VAFRNYKAWRANLVQEQERIRYATRAAVPAVGRGVRDLMRERIPPGATRSLGMPNVFPGYAATGHMKTTIVAGPVEERARGVYAVRVGMARGARKLDFIKAHVHERGMHIYPRRAKMLRFVINGEVIFARHVYIRPKRWASSAWDEATQLAPQMLHTRFLEMYGRFR
jgi:hypothetical protein